MFLAYAIILGSRLKEESDQGRAPDRILLCGPGRATAEANKRALLEAGWTHIIPVELIEAGHLDKSWSKRHAWVFTKLRVLELRLWHARVCLRMRPLGMPESMSLGISSAIDVPLFIPIVRIPLSESP